MPNEFTVVRFGVRESRGDDEAGYEADLRALLPRSRGETRWELAPTGGHL